MNSGARRATVIWRHFLHFALLILAGGCTLGRDAVDVAQPRFEGPPLIRIASPLPDQTFLAGATVIVQARIENAGPDLSRISILLDGAVLGEHLNPNPSGAALIPVTMDWPTSSPGQFEFAVEAARPDGTIARETVSLSVVAESGMDQTSRPAETSEESERSQQPSEPSGETMIDVPPVSTSVPASATDALASRSIAIPAVITVPANLRLGPGTNFELVGSIAVGEAVEIVGVNAARDWYHIRYGDLGDAWIYSELLQPDGDVSTLPVESGPAQPTAIPAEQGGINLTIAGIVLQPNPLVCNEVGAISLTIHNEGDVDTPSGGWFTVQDSVPDANMLGEPMDQIPFSAVPAGGTVAATVNLSVNYHSDVRHRLTVTINTGGHIIETTTEDNSDSIDYILARGACP